MTGYKGCIIDPCGTLLDLDAAYRIIFGRVLGTFGMDFDGSEACDYADMSAEELFERLNTGCTCRFRDFMIMIAAECERNLVPSAGLFPDAVGFLDLLDAAGCPCAAFSNLYGEQVSALLERFSIGDRFRGVMGLERIVPPRPDPLPLRILAGELGADPGDVLLVSASPKDIEAGRRAGMDAVLIDRSGCRGRPEGVRTAGGLSEVLRSECRASESGDSPSNPLPQAALVNPRVDRGIMEESTIGAQDFKAVRDEKLCYIGRSM